MHFDLEQAVAVLERTPATLRALLGGLGDAWVGPAEPGGGWSPIEIVAHLIHGERTDWIVRARIILEHGEACPFTPFDREGHRAEAAAAPLDELLRRFATLRTQNLEALRTLALSDDDLDRAGRHPAFGRVTLRELLATWTAHDLGHVRQIARAMAKRYRGAVGPWREYLPVMDE